MHCTSGGKAKRGGSRDPSGNLKDEELCQRRGAAQEVDGTCWVWAGFGPVVDLMFREVSVRNGCPWWKDSRMGQQFGDTTLTKVFVGGLAWETREEAMREHFDRFGDILEAVIISDKHTGLGFDACLCERQVTFKEAEAAKHACEDASPVINGRRANCNLASLGAKRAGLRPEPPSTRRSVIGATAADRSSAVVLPRPLHNAAAIVASSVPTPSLPQCAPILPHRRLQVKNLLRSPYPGAGQENPPDSAGTCTISPLSRGTGAHHVISDPFWVGRIRMGHTGGLVAAAGTMPVYPLYQFQQHQPPFFHAPNATTAVATVPSAIQPAPPTGFSLSSSKLQALARKCLDQSVSVKE
ncbi:hypothetical protein ZIOFF_058096 [Zingiber officinale]|uniref:RRM domain-containing protein n=1 Tax=Zingiber officinale TaxID=94328 RepID=A0A8J5F7Z0_ZINOF|nr:hypothetical protein ZIOFF_058096 [Zingiber officinale]